MPRDVNPYSITTREQRIDALDSTSKYIGLSRLSIIVLVANVASFSCLVLCAYFNWDPLSVPFGEVLVWWVVIFVPVSTVVNLIFCITVDRRTPLAGLRITVSLVTIVLWTGLALHIVTSMIWNARWTRKPWGIPSETGEMTRETHEQGEAVPFNRAARLCG